MKNLKKFNEDCRDDPTSINYRRTLDINKKSGESYKPESEEVQQLKDMLDAVLSLNNKDDIRKEMMNIKDKYVRLDSPELKHIWFDAVKKWHSLFDTI